MIFRKALVWVVIAAIGRNGQNPGNIKKKDVVR